MEIMSRETASGQRNRSNQETGAHISVPRLSLYEIETVLSDLAALRSEMIEAGEDTSAVEDQILQYVSKEITKVDHIASYLKHCSMMELAAKEEMRAMSSRAKTWADRAAQLKDVCIRVMESIGQKRLDGLHNSIIVKANGGKQAVEVRDESMIPDEFCNVTITMQAPLWRTIQQYNDLIPGLFNEKRYPVLTAIAAELDETCRWCNGNGVVESGVIGPEHPGESPCGSCGGSGKRGVPGAVLLPRGQHVEIR